MVGMCVASRSQYPHGIFVHHWSVKKETHLREKRRQEAADYAILQKALLKTANGAPNYTSRFDQPRTNAPDPGPVPGATYR